MQASLDENGWKVATHCVGLQAVLCFDDHQGQQLYSGGGGEA